MLVKPFISGEYPPERANSVNAVIEKSGLSKHDFNAIISTSVTKDFIEPSMASIVLCSLKMPPECINFDLGSACLGFLNGIHVASSLIESGQMNHVLVVAAENTYDMVEATLKRLEQETATLQDVHMQLATLTLGSGAVAMIISRTSLAPLGHPIRGLVTLASTEHSHLCRGWSDRMLTDGPKLLAAGLALALLTYKKAQAELDWQISLFDEFALHQVSKPYTKMFLKELGIEPRKVMTTFPAYGNIGPVSLPFTVSKLEEAGRLKKGKRLAMMGIGSGLNCMMMDVQW